MTEDILLEFFYMGDSYSRPTGWTQVVGCGGGHRHKVAKLKKALYIFSKIWIQFAYRPLNFLKISFNCTKLYKNFTYRPHGRNFLGPQLHTPLITPMSFLTSWASPWRYLDEPNLKLESFLNVGTDCKKTEVNSVGPHQKSHQCEPVVVKMGPVACGCSMEVSPHRLGFSSSFHPQLHLWSFRLFITGCLCIFLNHYVWIAWVFSSLAEAWLDGIF